MCRELEALCSVEMCICLRQVGLQLYTGKCKDTMVYVPVRESSIFTQTIESRKNAVINEAPKEREKVQEVRTALGITTKLTNLMIVPLGEN